MGIWKLLLATFLMGITTLVWADQFVVRDIQINGLQRVDEGVVYNALPIHVGETLDTKDTKKIMRALYETQFFSDITLERQGNRLVINVVERSTIGSMEISGNKLIESEDLEDGLRMAGISEGQPFVPSVLGKVEKELEQQYFNQGLYNVKITTEVVDLPRNRVGVSIEINEGTPTKIRQINIIGNKDFTEKRLLKNFSSTTPSLLTWITKTDQYSKERLMGDLEALRSFYLDRGYINFNITSTQVSIVPSKEDIYLTVNIVEGEQYTVSKISLSGDLIVPEEELRKVIVIKEGELFSREKVLKSSEYIAYVIGDKGYAFVEATPVPTIDEENKTVAIDFHVVPNQLVYVRRINFAGNFLTRDDIMRREMTQLEGGLVSTQKIQRSRNKLYMLGYLDQINIETERVPGSEDLVDLNVSAEEKPSGQLKGGVGYSQLDGFLFNAGITQNNFLGTGNIVNFLFNKSESFTSYNLGYTNPFYTPDGVSRGFNFFYQETNLGEENVSNYIRDIYGGVMSYGIPVNPNNRLSAGLGYDHTLITVSSDPATVSTQVSDFIAENGNNFNTLRLSSGWNYNSLDRAVFPRQGMAHSMGASAAAPASTLTYYKLNSLTRWYHPLFDRSTFMVRGAVAYGDGFFGTAELPFYENYYLGGIGTLRGFTDNTVGPKDSMGDPFGGNFRFNAAAEVFFPIPLIDISSVRTSVFVDAGDLYDTYTESVDLAQTRVSTGVAMQWLSPVGPFVVSLGFPLHEEEGDSLQPFQFTIGSML